MTSFYSEEELRELGFKEIGTNVLISRKTSIYGARNMSIGNDVRIDDFSILSGHITIGNNVHIAAGVMLFAGEAGIILKDYTGVSSRTAIYAASDDYTGIAMTNPTIPDEFRHIIEAPVVLEPHALIGTGCTVLPGVTLGHGAAVGSMSLVTKDLPEFSLSIGIPAHVIKDRKRNLLDLEQQFLEQKGRQKTK